MITHLSKILLLIILERLKAALESCLSEEQGGFRKDRSTVQQILTLRLIAEKYLERGKRVYNCFVDYTKAFDSVWHAGLWAVLRSFRVPGKLINLLRNLYAKSRLAVKIGIRLGEWFTAELGNRQGDPISPLSFISLLERVMETTECNTVTHGVEIKDLRYTDDVDLLAETEDELQSLVDQLHTSSKGFGLKFNINKSKVMVFERRTNCHPTITVDTNVLECVPEFVYLGSLMTKDNDCSAEISRRINLASQRLGMLKTIWSSSELTVRTKIDVLVT